MPIAKNSVVSFHYKVATTDGQTVDQSQGDPLTYLHGHGQIIPGLEGLLAGRAQGDQFKAEVSPDQAYGAIDPELDLQVPLEAFPDDAKPQVQPGFRFQAEHPTKPGQVILFRVCGLKDDQVFVSGNHPLAGQALVFDIAIAEVREATAEELAHGHVHGGAGCHHHHADECCQDQGKAGNCHDQPGCCGH
jgi:FKBP-type peptidyl-prolyl cis-trans isomerase SlyD